MRMIKNMELMKVNTPPKKSFGKDPQSIPKRVITVTGQ